MSFHLVISSGKLSHIPYEKCPYIYAGQNVKAIVEFPTRSEELQHESETVNMKLFNVIASSLNFKIDFDIAHLESDKPVLNWFQEKGYKFIIGDTLDANNEMKTEVDFSVHYDYLPIYGSLNYAAVQKRYRRVLMPFMGPFDSKVWMGFAVCLLACSLSFWFIHRCYRLKHFDPECRRKKEVPFTDFILIPFSAFWQFNPIRWFTVTGKSGTIIYFIWMFGCLLMGRAYFGTIRTSFRSYGYVAKEMNTHFFWGSVFTRAYYAEARVICPQYLGYVYCEKPLIGKMEIDMDKEAFRMGAFSTYALNARQARLFIGTLEDVVKPSRWYRYSGLSTDTEILDSLPTFVYMRRNNLNMRPINRALGQMRDMYVIKTMQRTKRSPLLKYIEEHFKTRAYKNRHRGHKISGIRSLGIEYYMMALVVLVIGLVLALVVFGFELVHGRKRKYEATEDGVIVI